MTLTNRAQKFRVAEEVARSRTARRVSTTLTFGVSERQPTVAESTPPALAIGGLGFIVRIATNAAATQPDLRQIREDGLARHHAGARTVCELLRKRHALRRGLRVDTAADTLAAVTDVALMLSDHYGWTPDQIESWMIATARMSFVEPDSS